MIPGGCPECKGTDIEEMHLKSRYLGEYVLATCRACGNVWTELNAEYPCDCDTCKYRNGCPSGQVNYALRMQRCNTGCFEPGEPPSPKPRFRPPMNDIERKMEEVLQKVEIEYWNNAMKFEKEAEPIRKDMEKTARWFREMEAEAFNLKNFFMSQNP
jgi:hypothetical protein